MPKENGIFAVYWKSHLQNVSKYATYFFPIQTMPEHMRIVEKKSWYYKMVVSFQLPFHNILIEDLKLIFTVEINFGQLL